MKAVVFQNRNDIIAAPTAFPPADPEEKSRFSFPSHFELTQQWFAQEGQGI